MKTKLLLASAMSLCFAFSTLAQKREFVKVSKEKIQKEEKLDQQKNQKSTQKNGQDYRSAYFAYTFQKSYLSNTTGAIELKADYNESISQAYESPGENILLQYLHFEYDNENENTTIEKVKVSIYNIDNNNNPIGEALQTQFVDPNLSRSSSKKNFTYIYCRFDDLYISGRYAVVISPTGEGNQITIQTNDPTPNQEWDEDYTRLQSSYYETNGWEPIQNIDLNGDESSYNFEPLIGIQYNVPISNKYFNSNSHVACLDQPFTYSYPNSPFFTHKMYNWGKFWHTYDHTNYPDDISFYYKIEKGRIEKNDPYEYIYDLEFSKTYITADTHYFYPLFYFGNTYYEIKNNVIVNTTEDLEELDASVTLTIGSLATKEYDNYVKYQWYNCDTNQEIEGETYTEFYPEKSGNYKVTVTNGCDTKESECVNFIYKTYDALEYAYAKNYFFENGADNYFVLEPSKNQSISQTFLGTEEEIEILGISMDMYIIKRKDISINARVSIYKTDLNNNPIGEPLITELTDGNTSELIFENPIKVSGNYAIVINNDSEIGDIGFLTTDPTPEQAWDEDFVRFKSSDLTNNTWMPLQEVDFEDEDNVKQFDIFFAPIVAYEIDNLAQFNISKTTVCEDTEVTFSYTNISSIVNNRMMNINKFANHFGLVKNKNENIPDYTYDYYYNEYDDNYNPNPGETGRYTYDVIGKHYGVSYLNYGFVNEQSITNEFVINVIENTGATTATIIKNENTLTAVETGEHITYQWINCEDNSVIEGEINQSYTPTKNGTYKVIISNLCESTESACETVEILSVSDINTKALKVYPNPSQDYIKIDGLTEESKISIIDFSGRVISTTTVNNSSNEISVNHLNAGTYFLKVESKNNNQAYKIIKK